MAIICINQHILFVSHLVFARQCLLGGRILLHIFYLSQFEVNASVTEVLLTELRPGESYQVSLQAINIAGSSPPVTTTITLPVSSAFTVINYIIY